MGRIDLHVSLELRWRPLETLHALESLPVAFTSLRERSHVG
jgi:hypothetical protein